MSYNEGRVHLLASCEADDPLLLNFTLPLKNVKNVYVVKKKRYVYYKHLVFQIVDEKVKFSKPVLSFWLEPSNPT